MSLPTAPPPAPGAQDREALALARAGQDWPRLLVLAEALVPGQPFWLDPHRLAAESLEALDRREAAQAVTQEVRALVLRMPGLLQLACADGSPCADEATRLWIQGPAQPGPADPLAPLLAQASALTARGEPAQAVAVLAAGARAAVSARLAFRCRLALLPCLAQQNHGKVIEALSRDLLAELDTVRLPHWEPDLALAGLQAVLQGLRSARKDRNEALIGDVFTRITALDPALAMTLG